MTDSLSVKVLGVPELQRNIQMLDDMMSEYLEGAVRSGAMIVQNAAKENIKNIPLYKTGTLGRSVHMETITKTNVLVMVAVGTDLIYAAIHEFGGIITPKTAKALRFKIGGQWITAKLVVMPARPYLRPALDNNIKAIEAEIADFLRQVLGRLPK